MATTKLWHIQGRLKDLVDYVENPEKTVKPGLQDFFNVFSYTQIRIKQRTANSLPPSTARKTLPCSR